MILYAIRGFANEGREKQGEKPGRKSTGISHAIRKTSLATLRKRRFLASCSGTDKRASS